MGSNPVQGWIFFRPFFHCCLSSVHYCEDHFHIQNTWLLRRRDSKKYADIPRELPSLVEEEKMKPEVPGWIFNKFLQFILIFLLSVVPLNKGSTVMGGGGNNIIPITISPRVWHFKINSGRFLDYEQPSPPPRSLSRELKKERCKNIDGSAPQVSLGMASLLVV